MIIRQKVLPNARLDDDVGIWKSFIVYEVWYLVFEAKAIIGFMAGFFMKLTILIEVPSRRYGIRNRCGI